MNESKVLKTFKQRDLFPMNLSTILAISSSNDVGAEKISTLFLKEMMASKSSLVPSSSRVPLRKMPQMKSLIISKISTLVIPEEISESSSKRRRKRTKE